MPKRFALIMLSTFLLLPSLGAFAVQSAPAGSSAAQPPVGEMFGRHVEKDEFDFANKTVSVFSISNKIAATDGERRAETWKHLILLDEAKGRGIVIPPALFKEQMGRLLSEKKITYGSLDYFEWVQKTFGEDHKTLEKRVEDILKVKGLIDGGPDKIIQDIFAKAAFIDYMEQKTVIMETSQGVIELRLMPMTAPKAVENFTRLAEKGYYDGLTFHRVIKGFMIQGGDPEGNGTGGQSIWGEPFEDEFSEAVRFDKPGILAMANSGPGTNGSQFFITTAPTPRLHGVHTIFGEVRSGYDVVQKISEVPVGDSSRPLMEQKILRMTVKQWDKK